MPLLTRDVKNGGKVDNNCSGNNGGRELERRRVLKMLQNQVAPFTSSEKKSVEVPCTNSNKSKNISERHLSALVAHVYPSNSHIDQLALKPVESH